MTSTSPASFYWGINQSVKYGSTTISSSVAGIVDTGTTLLYIASGKPLKHRLRNPVDATCTDAFSKYKSATGATADSATGLLKITSAQYANLQNLVFTIGGTTFTLTPNAQIWPVSINILFKTYTPSRLLQRNLNTLIGGSANSIYLIVGNIGTPSGEGLDFIDGQVFLERFYSVFGNYHHSLR